MSPDRPGSNQHETNWGNKNLQPAWHCIIHKTVPMQVTLLFTVNSTNNDSGLGYASVVVATNKTHSEDHS